MATTSGPVNLAYAIVALVVVVIVVSTVALPILGTMSDEFKTEYNNGGSYYSSVVSSTVTITYDNPTLTVNGVEVPLIDGDNTTRRPVFISDIGYLALYTPNGFGNASVWDSGTSSKLGWGYIDGFTMTINPTTKTISISDVTVSQGVAPADYTGTYKKYCWAISATHTDYMGYDINTPAAINYVNSIDDVVAMVSYTGGMGIINGHDSVTTDDSEAELNLNLTPVSNSDDIGSFVANKTAASSDLTFTVGGNTATPSVYIVPTKIVGSLKGFDSISPLFNVIEILLILVPVMMAVFLLRGRS